MIIHSPIISGSLTFANGATFTLPDNGIYSGSFSGSVTGIGDPSSFSASLQSKIQQLNTDTGSQDARLDLIESYTSSLDTKNSTLATYTGSVSSQLSNLNTATSSYETKGRSVVSGSSQITYASISSIPAGIVSGSTQTIANLPTGTVSGSSQVVGILSSLNTYTGSNDTTNTAQSARLTTIESVTGSYETKGRSIVSGSAQIDGSLLGSNKTITIGSTSTTLGGTSTTIVGLTSVTSTGFTGALTGNASTATTAAALTTARTINGTSFDGSANITIPNLVSGSAQISLGSVTGNSTSNVTEGSNLYYTDARVKTKLNAETVVSGSSQISLTGTTGYGTYIDQALLTTSNVTHNNVTVSGNLTVNGTTTTVNSTTLQIGDNIIELNGNGSANGGLLVKDPTAPTTTSGSLLWDSTNDYWKAGAAGSELPLVTTSGTQTLTNKTISGASNTLSNIGNAQLTNSSTTIGTTAISLGASSTTLAGLTSVTSTAFVGALTGNASTVTTNANLTGDVTSVGNATTIGAAKVTNAMLAGSISNANLANSAITIGSTSTALGATSTTLAGLTSVTSTTFVGALTGNASTATTAGTVTTAAQSAITSVGTLTGLTVSGATATGALTVTGAITATGDITAFSASDIRFKENITAIESPIEKIKMISGNTYDWKAENKDIHGFEGNDVGVIAQEIEEVLPQLVVTRDNGYKAVKYDKLVALLIEGIKEQQKQIEDLSNKINKLETGL